MPVMTQDQFEEELDEANAMIDKYQESLGEALHLLSVGVGLKSEDAGHIWMQEVMKFLDAQGWRDPKEIAE